MSHQCNIWGKACALFSPAFPKSNIGTLIKGQTTSLVSDLSGLNKMKFHGTRGVCDGLLSFLPFWLLVFLQPTATLHEHNSKKYAQVNSHNKGLLSQTLVKKQLFVSSLFSPKHT